MGKKIILSIITCSLLILPVVAIAEQKVIRPKIITTFYDGNVPVWGEGDYWTYTGDYYVNYEGLFEFDWHINNLRLSVDEVTGSYYNLKITGGITGEVSAGVIRDRHSDNSDIYGCCRTDCS